MQFTVTEKQNVNDHREGTKIEVSCLAEAKRKASSMQAFQNTVMTIEIKDTLIAYKKKNTWINCEI